MTTLLQRQPTSFKTETQRNWTFWQYGTGHGNHPTAGHRQALALSSITKAYGHYVPWTVIYNRQAGSKAVCPDCGSCNIEGEIITIADTDLAERNCCCADCCAEWTDYYTIASRVH